MEKYKELIGIEIRYGSPGYPMRFIPRAIKVVGKHRIEITGDIPNCQSGEHGHFFQITRRKLDQFIRRGRTFWIADDGAHSALSTIEMSY